MIKAILSDQLQTTARVSMQGASVFGEERVRAGHPEAALVNVETKDWSHQAFSSSLPCVGSVSPLSFLPSFPMLAGFHYCCFGCKQGCSGV